MPRQSVRVHIFNQTYTLVTDDEPDAVQKLAHEIDELMSSIASRVSSGDSTRVAVLACMHLADKLHEAEKRLRRYENKSEEIGSLLDRALN